MKLDDKRREYRYGKLEESSLAESPFEQFETWMSQAIEAGIEDPTAMTVSTVNSASAPWSRIVLLKSFENERLCFYTNLASRKAREIEAHPRVALHFPWLQMDRQVIASGNAARLQRDEAETYFATRPRESQIAAHVATQSEEIESRSFLDDRYNELVNAYEGKDVPMPEDWGGYAVAPDLWEFWQGGEHRLHDRFEYRLDGSRWLKRRLAP